MVVVLQVAAGIAATLHVVFFTFESVLFRRPQIQKRFLVEPGAAEAVRPWALNQGFYNLFLALGCFTGLVAMHVNVGIEMATARALVLFPCACMVGAGAVLAASDKRLLQAAVMQLVPPLVALVAAALG